MARKDIYRRLCVVTALLPTFLRTDAYPNGQSPCDSASLTLMERTWREFRALHPFSFQTVGLKHFGVDTCVFVMSEPAEWVKKECLDSLFAEYGGHVITAKKKFGFDGALYDAVGSVRLNNTSFNRFEKRLFTILYGTDEKPFYTDLDYPLHHVYFAENRLDTINPRKWLVDICRQKFFHYPIKKFSGFSLPFWGSDYYQGLNETFIQSYQARRAIDEINHGLNETFIPYYPRHSMYYSEKRGAVIWVINPSDSLFTDSQFHKYARRFVLDSDLVLAAFCYGGNIFLIGREREIPVNVLPPLRTETICLLASLDEGEFSVSINSNADSDVGFDGYVEGVWAKPVEMSDKLRNTELGNLLLLTNVQLLSWGSQLKAREAFIDYPQPTHPSFDLGFTFIDEEPDAYYWKLPDAIIDKGEAFADSVIYTVLDNPGCLLPLYSIPPFHLPDNIDFEESAYNVFSSLNSTDLIRAAQYGLIYKAFQFFKKERGNRVAYIHVNANDSWVRTPSMTIMNVPKGTVNYLE